jgi:anaerobic ribonucleoside-triphosphate reductase
MSNTLEEIEKDMSKKEEFSCKGKTREELLEELSRLKEERKNAHGTPCEVYSRVVGYLRPVALWNEGKKEEYKVRKMYSVDSKYHE